MPKLPASFLEGLKEHNRAASPVLMGELFEMLDRLNGDQLAEIVIWLAEHPMPGTRPLDLALKQFNALEQDEVVFYIQEIKNQYTPELWKLLTED